MIISDKATRDKAIKALEYINSQDKDKIREGLSIAHDMFHDIANSAPIVREINESVKISRRGNYYAPVLELNEHYSYVNIGSITGDISTTLVEFFQMVDKNIPVYDNRPKNSNDEEDEDTEYEEDEDEEEEA